jgi:hypothetical protein
MADARNAESPMTMQRKPESIDLAAGSAEERSEAA